MGEVDYGYGDEPDMGYGDAQPDMGYGDASPDMGYGEQPDMGYGDDTKPATDMGYGSSDDGGQPTAPRRQRPKRRCSVTKYVLESSAADQVSATLDMGAKVREWQNEQAAPSQNTTATASSFSEDEDDESPKAKEKTRKSRGKKTGMGMMGKLRSKMSVM
jgi:hypothetical protein